MYRTILVLAAGTLALGFVQVAIAGGVTTAGTTQFVDVVAQKLEDHHQGVNLDNKITLDDCRAAFEEFEEWASEPETVYRANTHEGSLAVARHYLSDFLHRHLKHELERGLTNEYIAKLESTYEKARPSYTHKTPLQCQDGTTATPELCALVASLNGQGKSSSSLKIAIEAGLEEMNGILDRMYEISEEGLIYEDTDSFLDAFKVYNTPEVEVIHWSIVDLYDAESEELLEQADPAETKKYMDTYKHELAKYLSLVQE